MIKREIKDLIISWLILSLAFAFVFTNFRITWLLNPNIESIIILIYMMPVALVAVGTGFIFHELAHRYMARKYGAFAEYRAFYPMLGVALFFSFILGVIFAAPGAVMIGGKYLSRKQNGIISLAGPATNIIVAIAFLTILIANNFLINNQWINTFAFVGMTVNLILAAFNLLPIWVLDGQKVFVWNPKIWAIFFFPVAAIVFFLLFR